MAGTAPREERLTKSGLAISDPTVSEEQQIWEKNEHGERKNALDGRQET